MLILAIDAATRYSGIAVLEDEVTLAEYAVQSQLTHSQRLLPAIDLLLGDLPRSVSDVDAIVVSKGPGSFTGLRIGMSLAKGLAQALSIPIVGIGSLEHWAHSLQQHREELLFLPLLDAQRGEFYSALYAWGDDSFRDMAVFLEPKARSLAALQSELRPYGERTIVITGDILPKRRAELSDWIANQDACFVLADDILARPRPASLGLLGLQRLQRGETDSLFSLAPEYLRLSEAERQRLGREAEEEAAKAAKGETGADRKEEGR